MTTTTYALTGLHCGACVKRVTEALQPLADNVTVTLSPMQATLTAPRASFAQLKAAVALAGDYTLEPSIAAISAVKTAVSAAEYAQAAIHNVAKSQSEIDSKSWLATYYPLLLIIGFILGSSLLLQAGLHTVTLSETMRYFMAGFFLVFAFFKLLDIRAFADAYAGYDLLAARWHGWGMLYPFVELALGMAYLAHYNPVVTHWATIIVMGFSAIGVIRAVTRKTQIQCACLGTVFKLPMSTVTIIEDVGMVCMAAFMLFNA